MNILLLGSTGMLGNEILDYFFFDAKENQSIHQTSRNQMDRAIDTTRNTISKTILLSIQDGDLLSVFNFDFDGNLFSCVPDYVVMNGHLSNQINELKDVCKKLDIEYMNGESYFNCRITLFNNERIQKEIETYINTISTGLEKYHKIQWNYADQGLINSLFKIIPLPKEYNVEVWCQQLAPNDIIRHYIGGAKQLLDKIVAQSL